MGIADMPPARMPASRKAAAVALAYGRGLVLAPGRLLPRKRLTETYLRDPSLRARVGIEGEKDVSRPPAA